MRSLLAAFFVLLCAAPLYGALAMAPVEKPVELQRYLKSDAPHGAGRLTYLFWDIYDAALWMDGEQWSMHKPFALSLTYLNAIPRDRLIDGMLDEMENQAHVDQAKRARAKAILDRAIPDIQERDRMTAVFTGTQTVFYFNGKRKLAVSEPWFHEAFFALWLSQQTPDKEMREKLMGHGNS
jgi:hypothetical protein